ncbi:hypothetical protein D3C81_1955960 [compost metagenome]
MCCGKTACQIRRLKGALAGITLDALRRAREQRQVIRLTRMSDAVSICEQGTLLDQGLHERVLIAVHNLVV